MKELKIIVNDKMQANYVYYLTEPTGKNFDPEFKPELTPAQMLELGVFGGVYMRDCTDEFPSTWFKNAKLALHEKDISLNYFKVDASQPLAAWVEKLWVNKNDPRGWFQWYCRYYRGRRSMDDERQIKRWKAMKRHISQIKINCAPGDLTCRPRQRQALLHWAYDSRVL
jgi:hypothetical protein